MEVSAVLFSEANFLMDSNSELANRFVTVVHNPLAKNPLPHGWLGFGSEIVPVINGDSVSWNMIRLNAGESD